MTTNDWKKIKSEILLHYPKLSERAIEATMNSLKEAEKNMVGETSPYFLSFRNIMLRIGIQVIGTSQKTFIHTEAGLELEKLLKD